MKKVMTASVLLIASAVLVWGCSSSSKTADAGGRPGPIRTLDASDLKWYAIAYGQSVDLTFAANVLKEKIGVNDVTIAGRKLDANVGAPLAREFTIESRGGKIANSHDGMTIYYTVLPSDVNFVLEADVTVTNFGPETTATPNAQESAGLIVRDTIGAPRQNPTRLGYEEVPAASNMVLNALITQNRRKDNVVRAMAVYRDGVNFPWGNPGAKMVREAVKSDIDLGKTPTFKLRLERNNTGFVATYANADGSGVERKVVDGIAANAMHTIEADRIYVGFFAARNATMKVTNPKITLSAAKIVDAPKYAPSPDPLLVRLASSELTASEDYIVQAQANYPGKYSVQQDGKALGADVTLAAGEMLAVPAKVAAESEFTVTFTASAGPKRDAQVLKRKVVLKKVANPRAIIAAANGKADGAGTYEAPLDLNTAMKLVPAGGAVFLVDGDYAATTFPVDVSGSHGKLKYLVAAGKKVVFSKGLALDANHWHFKGIETTGKPFRISGSYNVLEEILSHDADDTGLQLSSPDVGRALWASHNLVLNSESWNNIDPAKENADGYAAKIRVGDGNIFRNCIARHNIDDGWDLYNKLEDGRNGVVIIEGSLAYSNGMTEKVPATGGGIGNGFKLGGEGLPVPHVIRNSVAFGNNMDGFSDNFNPGALVVENNTAFDNNRFNFIFRPSAYGGPQTQGFFRKNLSLRSNYAGKNDDTVFGNIDDASAFATGGKTVSKAGKAVTLADVVSTKAPEKFTRGAGGVIQYGDFLKPKAGSAAVGIGAL